MTQQPFSRPGAVDLSGLASTVPCELPALQCPRDRVAIADLASRRVYQIGAPFHLGDERIVEEVLGLWMERGVDRDHVADLHQRLGVGVEGQAQLFLDLRRQPVPIGVMQLHVEGLETAQNR